MRTIHKLIMVGGVFAFGLSLFFNYSKATIMLIPIIILYNLKYGGDYCEVCGNEYERDWNFKNKITQVDINMFVSQNSSFVLNFFWHSKHT